MIFLRQNEKKGIIAKIKNSILCYVNCEISLLNNTLKSDVNAPGILTEHELAEKSPLQEESVIFSTEKSSHY